MGLARCVEKDRLDDIGSKSSKWKSVKGERGKAVSSPARGQLLRCLICVPLSEVVGAYCVLDVGFLPNVVGGGEREVDKGVGGDGGEGDGDEGGFVAGGGVWGGCAACEVWSGVVGGEDGGWGFF